MLRHSVQITAATLLLLLCTLLPFLSGGYDGFAMSLSGMAQIFGIVGLILVPLGVIWLVGELRIRGASGSGRQGGDYGYWLGLASIGVASFVALAVSVIPLIHIGVSLWLSVISLWGYCAFRFAGRLRTLRQATVRSFNPAPLYLIVLPIMAALFKFVVLEHAVEVSRNRVMDNGVALIRDIERFRDAHGHYPPSLLAVHQDYKTSVIGVEKYLYEPSGAGYNLSFEHFANIIGTQEFVVYNPRGENEMTGHAADLLEFTGRDLALRRGYYAVRDASRPGWKRFLFD